MAPAMSLVAERVRSVGVISGASRLCRSSAVFVEPFLRILFFLWLIRWSYFRKQHAEPGAKRGDADKEDCQCRSAAARNFSGAKQDITNNQVSQRPSHVCRWRRQSFSWRVGEWSREPLRRNPMRQMRHNIGEKHAG